MSIFTRGRTETRALSYQDVWGSGGDPAPALHGDSVSGALRLAPVYSATSLIANLISTAPMKAYRESTPGILSAIPRQPQLCTNPQPIRGSRIDWLHQSLASVLLTGNSVGYIVAVDNAGTAAKVQWLNPNDVQIIEEQNDLYHTPEYYWRGRRLEDPLVVHVAGYTMPGSVKGLSPIGLFKRQIETGLSAQDFALDWYQNGAAPSGHFKNTAKTLLPGQADKIKQRFKAAVQNRDLLVTGADWDWTALGVPADESRFLEAIKANATTIASIFHVEPEMIGGQSGHPMTYKTLEQDGIRLNTRALRPWAARYEAVLSGLLPRPQHIGINLDDLARGTILERMQAHQLGLATGVETIGEARADEGRPPLTDDELAAWQANYKAAAGAIEPASPTDPTKG